MAGNDELIYRIKFETDDSTYQESLDKIRKLNEEKKKGASTELNEQLRESVEVSKEFNESNLETIDKLIELRKQIDSYQESLSELRKAKRDGVELTEEQREGEVQVRGALKEASQAYRDNQKDLIANKTAVEGSVKSYNQLSAQMKLQEQQLRNMPIDENNKEYVELQKGIATTRAEMKKFNAELGDHSMNVGNYTEALSTAASGLAIIQGPLGPLAGRLNSLNTTIQRSIPLLKTKIAAWGALRLAIMATGIGALVIALGTVIAALSKMQPVIDAVTKRMQQLGAIWGFMTDRVGAFFGMNEKSNFSLRESIRIAGELADAEVKLDEARIESIETLAQLQTEVSMLRREAEDEMNTHQERIDMMEKALAKTQEQFEIEKSLADERLRIAEARAGLARNERTDNEEINKLRAESIRLEGQAAMQERQLLRRKQSIINSLRVEEERRRKNIQAIRDEAAEVVRATEQRIDAMRREARERLDESRGQRLIDNLRANNQERMAIELEAEREMDKVMDDAHKRREQAAEDAKETEEAIFKELMLTMTDETEARTQAQARAEEIKKAEIIAINASLNDELTAINEERVQRLGELADDEIREQKNIVQQIEQLRHESAIRQGALEAQVRTQAHRDLIILEAEQEQRELELREEYLDKFDDQEEAHRLARDQAELEHAQQKQDLLSQIEEEGLQYRLDMEQAYADLTFGLLTTMFGDSKEVQVAMAIVDTYVAANKALASAPPPLSTVRAAAAIAMGMANVRQILKTNVGDKGTSGGASQGAALSSSRGFEVMDERQDGQVARQVAETTSSQQQDMNPTFIFEGDLDSEVMAIKVRKGNRTIDSKTLTTKSRS